MENRLTPKGKLRYIKLIEASAEVFLEEGFEKASMSQIIAKSGGSLSTAYKIFKNKEGLFSAMLEYFMQDVLAEIDTFSNKHPDDLKAFLVEFGEYFLDVATKGDSVAFYRLLISEGHKNNAKITNMYMEFVVSKINQVLINKLQEESDKGAIECENVELLAEQFIHAIRGPFITKLSLGLDVAFNDEIKKAAVRQCVEIFYKGLTN